MSDLGSETIPPPTKWGFYWVFMLNYPHFGYPSKWEICRWGGEGRQDEYGVGWDCWFAAGQDVEIRHDNKVLEWFGPLSPPAKVVE